MRELIEKVKQWGLDRNIVFTGAEGQDKRVMMEAQARYTLKETAELLDAYADQDIDKINDAIGDILVTLIVGASSDDDCYRSLKNLLSDSRVTFAQDATTNEEPFSESYTRSQLNNMHLLDLLKWRDVSSGEYSCCVNELNGALGSINREFNQLLSLKDCLNLAYDEIKNRTGKVINGQFIKDK